MNEMTDFISPVRASKTECQNQSLLVLSQTSFQQILNSVPDALLILNQNLQIVYCNSILTHSLGIANDDIFSKRPGEALNCVNHSKGKSGCGSSIYCRNCGLIKSILLSNLGKPHQDECTLVLKNGSDVLPLQVRLKAVPVRADHQIFTVLTLKDITAEKRQEDLQKTFIHDILNKIFILTNNIENLIKGYVPLDAKSINHLQDLAEKALQVVKNHRDLVKNEGKLPSDGKSLVNIPACLLKMENVFRQSDLARNKNMILLPSFHQEIITDPVLLDRVLENLIKNALEASGEGQTVTIGFDDERKAFFVHNEEMIPPEVQSKLFTSPVSTKGGERGMGLYSVKFITENLLRGHVSFESEEGRGTTFYVHLTGKDPAFGEKNEESF